MPDHLHFACPLPTTLSIADFMQHIKDGSANFINHPPGAKRGIAWQSGYDVLTFAKPQLPLMISYIETQREHHATHSIKAKLERCTSAIPTTNQSRRDDLRQ